MRSTPGGSGVRLAFDSELDREPRLPRLRDEPVQVLKARPAEPEQALSPAAEGRRRACASRPAPRGRSLDDLERLSLLHLIRVQPAPDGARLDGHHAHAVPDDVVQLARNPARSSATAARASASCSRSSWSARSCALTPARASGRWRIRPARRCEQQDDPGVVAPHLGRIVDRGRRRPLPERSRAGRDCLRSSRMPNRNTAARTLRNVASVERDETPVDERLDRADHEDRRGAPNGNRRHQKRGTIMTARSGTVIQSEAVGAPSLLRRTTSSTRFRPWRPPRAARTSDA